MLHNNHNKHMAIFAVCWTVVSFCYYLALFRMASFQGDLNLNCFVTAIAEFVGNLVIGAFLMQLGLKNTLIASFTLMAVSALVYLFPILTLDLWYAAILFTMRLATTCAFASVFFGTNSLFRADLVPIIFAVCNMLARLATMASPYVAGMRDTTAMAVFFSLACLGLLCAGFITEKGRRKKKKKKRRSRD